MQVAVALTTGYDRDSRFQQHRMNYMCVLYENEEYVHTGSTMWKQTVIRMCLT